MDDGPKESDSPPEGLKQPAPSEPGPAEPSGEAAAPAKRGRPKFDPSTAPGPRVIALYAGWALLWLGGWLIYSIWRGFPLIPGLVLTAAFVVVPLLLAGEGIRSLQARRFAQAALSLSFAVGFLGLALSGQIVRGMLFPGDTAPLPKHLPRDVSRVDYTASDGQPLAGLLFRAQDPKAPSLVYFHGNAESAGRNLELGLELQRHGCHVFVAEFRGFGGLPGSPTEAGLLLDGEAALGVITRELGTPPEKIVLCGRSLGSGVAAGLAGRGFGSRVVLLSPYTSITDVAARMAPRPLAWLAVRDRLDSRAALTSRSDVPLLVFHGDRDRVVPYELGQDLVAALGDRAELVTIPNIGHNDLLMFPHGDQIFARWASFARAP